MSTLEYGNVIKIVSTNPLYEGKFFFVDKLYDDKIVIISDKEIITLDITDQTLDDKTIEKIIVVYKPKPEHGFIFQHKLFVEQMIEIEFDDVIVTGKITNILNDKIIQVETTIVSTSTGTSDDIQTLYIPLDRGLPKQIISIKLMHKDKSKLQNVDVEDVEDVEDNDEMDGLLNVVEEEIEEQEQFYYSIEQQKNDFLENLLMYIPLGQRTPKTLKELNKMIKRYVELRSKYTTFSDGVYINHLHYEQLLESTIAFQNKLYVPITNNIHVKLSDPSKVEGIVENFFKETDIYDEWKKDFSDLKENIPFNKQLELIENFDNLIYHSKMKPNQIKNKDNYTLAYILGKTDYPLIIPKHFVVESFLGHPKFFIEYSKTILKRSFLMEKSNLALNPYYPFIYEIKKGKFCENVDNRINYVNDDKNETFKKYVKKIIPTMNEFINCVNLPFINMVDALNAMNILEINELNSSNYLLINEIIKKNVNKIKQNFLKTRSSYLTKPNKDKIVSNQINDDILSEYINLSKLPDLKKYYSNSEIFKMAEVDSHKLLSFHYSIRNFELYHSTDEEIRSTIEEIKKEKDSPLERKIHKKYFSKEEKDRDNSKPIIIRDLEIESEPGRFISTLDILYRELTTPGNGNGNYQITQSLDYFKDQVNILIDNGLNNIDGLFSQSAFKRIREFVIKNKIVNGDIALLNDQLYVWKDRWVEYKEEVPKKLVTVKGEIDSSFLEEKYSKKIHQLLLNMENDKQRVMEMRKILNEENKMEMKIMIQSFVKQNLSKELKYNNEKIFLEKEEIEDKGIIQSPHEKVRDKILQVYDLDTKYKALQLFIERYCKKGRDEYWYYCIDTGVKLLPTFFNLLASAFLITNNYDDILEQICLDQGALSDNGDKWVDKYSGYIIKNIEFDYDEGYTETGFKNITRSVIEKPEMPIKEDPIMNSIKALIKYAGLSDVEDDVEWIHTYVMQSHDTSVRVNKSATKAHSILYVIAIISVVLVYIQTLERIKFIKPFPNCKLSFSGFPLEDGDGGIKYLCCIVNKMNKPDLPFSSVARMKIEDLEKNVHDFIKKYLLTNLEIDDKLKERRLHKREEDVSHYTPWNLFLPRLKPFRPSVFEDIGSI